MGEFVELLAPAGSFEAFLGALNAGADAVYLGGERFGARAYADNFDAEQIVRALHIAHFYGKKIYLTVNTLLKERELVSLYEYLSPFYEAGLDGVIVQDFGVLRYIGAHFPGLPLHASTQMTVTGARGAALLKKMGVGRIVPARELSLREVRKMCEEAAVEVECFIHGAMCYCYSGQCLFSSILGGRSGNRGRCAQPCRLPYGIYDGKKPLLMDAYPLSLKDMCTLEYLPALLAAGIDSFKIEGRMKSPEYTAGVTAVYRKYIDLYYREGDSGFLVDPADMDRLRGLYIRSEIQTGYYERHNGREMVSLKNPGYSGSDGRLLSQIREKYVREPDKMAVRMQAEVRVGEPLRLKVMSADRDGACPAVEAAGEEVQPARKAPLTEEDVKKRLCKTGDSLLSVTDCEIRMEEAGFVPVRALNELRRQAAAAFEKAVIENRGGIFGENRDKILRENENRMRNGKQIRSGRETVENICEDREEDRPSRSIPTDCLVTTCGQLQAVVRWGGCRRVYIESDLFLAEYEEVLRITAQTLPGLCPDWYLALPYILRERDEPYLRRLETALTERAIPLSGFLVRNLEEMSYLLSAGHGRGGALTGYGIVPDAGLYCFNMEAARFLSAFTGEFTLPYELNAKEASRLVRGVRAFGMSASLIVYSRIPMMVTANCLQKTARLCKNGEGAKRQIYLKDRKGEAFPVVINCDHCYNVLYNCIPYSLHGAEKERERIGADALRYDFVTESGPACQQILEGNFPFAEYTAGHCKRGVE